MSCLYWDLVTLGGSALFFLPLGKGVGVSAGRWEGGQVLLFSSCFDSFCFCSCLIFGGALSILSTSCTPQLLYFVLLFTLYSCVYYFSIHKKMWSIVSLRLTVFRFLK